MRPLLAALAVLAAVRSPAQVVGEAANAASASRSGSAAGVSAVPGGLAAPALVPPALTPSLAASLAPAVAHSPGAPIPALAPSALVPIDPGAMKAKARDYTAGEWAKLAADSKDEGTRAVLRSMPGDAPSDPVLSMTLAGGEKFQGTFRGLAGGRMIFQTGDKFVGLAMDAGNIAEVRRTVDVMFDGADIRPAEVVVHDRPPLADPIRDLARYKGRVLDIDIRDLDDLKWSAQTVSGRLVRADADGLVLDGPKGEAHIQREFQRIDKAVLRSEHYSSRGQISSISGVDGKVAIGQAVEVLQSGGKITTGRYFGLRRDAQGDYVVIEVASSGGTRFRALRDFVDMRTPGYAKGALVEGGELLYSAPDR